MDDYIRREALIEKINEQIELPYNKDHSPRNWSRAFCAFEEVAHAIPAADVRPVVHGHWIGKEEAEKIFEENYSDYPYGQCSVCGHCDWDNTESEGFNFCPNCGADMMGGIDG